MANCATSRASPFRRPRWPAPATFHESPFRERAMEFNWLNLFLVLAVAWLSGSLLSRIGYPPVLGELAAGAIFGPPLLGIVHADQVTAILGRVGVLLMLVFVGTQ